MSLRPTEPPTIFLIIKESSQRVHRKNFRLLGGMPLHEYFMSQRGHQKIYIDTDSREILDFYSTDAWPNVTPYMRLAKHVALEVSGDISPAPLMISRFINTFWNSDAPFVCSHITSPFIKNETIDDAFSLINDFDSISSVDAVQEFAVLEPGFNSRPLNFSLDSVVKTQSLKPIAVLNGAFFIIKPAIFLSNYLKRISSRHYYYPISKLEALDIDTEYDLSLANLLVKTHENH